jgi:hypothetical protein
MPAKKTTAKNAKTKKTTARRVSTRRATAKKVTARNATAKKVTARKVTARKATVKKATAKKATKRATPRASRHSATPVRRSPARAVRARRGDLIVIDSTQVGSPAREGEVLKVTVGEFSVRYQVRWGDGRKTTISPGGGTARIIRT